MRACLSPCKRMSLCQRDANIGLKSHTAAVVPHGMRDPRMMLVPMLLLCVAQSHVILENFQDARILIVTRRQHAMFRPCPQS